ncbi:MAG: cadmium-translocating P-type ATPase [Clostridiaceae bacterium]|jgi:Cd2+/Zn2+-exporting ATPase|nr:cadmium-translocating P-type ATPase [Clostridiaceae bacterium]
MKKRFWRIMVAAVFFTVAKVNNLNIEWLNTVLYLISYTIAGGDIIVQAFKNIARGKVFDENFLMTIATVGAILISEYAEGIAVMLFFQVGELFQDYGVNKSRKSIANLMNIRPEFATVKRGEELITMDPDEVKVGDIIVIKAGERVPLDAIVIEGNSMVDTSALTGESIPRTVEAGNEILSGCINVNGVITAEVTKEYEESTVSKILDLVENASSRKSHSERFITRFAKYYTPVVVTLAALLAIVPPLVISGETYSDWIYRALSFLVVSCPCALVLSVPLTFFNGIGGASKKGILVKGSNYLEALAKTEVIVFDKTGTLTKGVFNVQEINSDGISQEELLELTAYAESYSNHPISKSILRAYGKEIDHNKVIDVEEISGHGVSATVGGKEILAGNAKLMKKMNITFTDVESIGTVVHVAVDEKYVGYILIADEIKDDSAQAIKEIKATNVKQTVMLTGDRKNVAEDVASQLNLDKVYAQLLPVDKVEKVEELLLQKSEKGKLAFVGDGINDAPVLARADIGIAMGGLGSDAAIEAADIVLMTDEPSKIVTAMKVAKKTLRISNENIVFAIGIKVAVLILSAIGVTTMWAAIFADVGVTILAVLNSFRALNVKSV